MTWEWQAEAYPYSGVELALWLVTATAVLAVGLWANAVCLRKAGFSPWWALLFLVPLLYLIGLWVFAFTRWPREASRPHQ